MAIFFFWVHIFTINSAFQSITVSVKLLMVLYLQIPQHTQNLTRRVKIVFIFLLKQSVNIWLRSTINRNAADIFKHIFCLCYVITLQQFIFDKISFIPMLTAVVNTKTLTITWKIHFENLKRVPNTIHLLPRAVTNFQATI